MTFFGQYFSNHSFTDPCSYAIQNQHTISFQMVYNITMLLKFHISPYWIMTQFGAIMEFGISRQRLLVGNVYPNFCYTPRAYLMTHVENPSKKMKFLRDV